MNDEIFDDLAIEKTCQQIFGIKLDIKEAIVRNVTTGITSKATLFKTTSNAHYLYVVSQSSMLRADVEKIVRSMELVPAQFMPPYRDEEYFKRVGIIKFKAMFPGKHIMSNDDTRYYETLASYNPALVRIAKVKGEIRAYVIETKQWKKVREYVFAELKVA